MTEIYRSENVVVFYEEKYSMLSKKWFTTCQNMTNKEYQMEMTVYAKLVKKYKPKKELVDTTGFLFTISPEMQSWFDNEIVSVYHEIGMYKAAFICSDDLIAQLSLEQALDETLGKKLVKQFFTDENEARNWIIED